VGICTKPKVCFNCSIPRHYVTDCPSWKKNQSVASYFDSAGRGLGFFHIYLPKIETTGWLNISNCGVVVIRRGQISIAELE
jgi:hypothetical protein